MVNTENVSTIWYEVVNFSNSNIFLLVLSHKLFKNIIPLCSSTKLSNFNQMNSNEQTTKNVIWCSEINFSTRQFPLYCHFTMPIWTFSQPVIHFTYDFFYHNSVCLHPNSNEVIATKFCTCHDSIAVLACAKICSNLMTRYWIIAKQKDSAEFALWLEVLLVRCAWGSTKTSFSPAENLKRQVLSLRNWYSLTEGIHLSGDQKWHRHLTH